MMGLGYNAIELKWRRLKRRMKIRVKDVQSWILGLTIDEYKCVIRVRVGIVDMIRAQQSLMPQRELARKFAANLEAIPRLK